MSYTEIRHEGGMPFGGMPHDALLYKLEETDPELVAGVRGDSPSDLENHYDEYVRAEIIDRTPDATYLESDHPRRDPTLSRTVLNLRHAGGRGPNDYRPPQHPELFFGFTGNDPRGADTQPRLDQVRAQMAARAREKEVRMGRNVGHGDFVEADRPWSGAAIEYDKKEIQRRMDKHMLWFPAQKEGRPWGRNTVADEYYGLRQRHGVVGDGSEGLYVPEQSQDRSAGGWLYVPVQGAETDGVRRVDRAASADSALWRHTAGDADLAVQRYTAARSGRETLGSGGTGGGRVTAARTDQNFTAHQQCRSGNRRVLAEGMSAAAAYRRAFARAAGGDADHGRSEGGRRPGRSAPELAQDIARAAYEARPDQAARQHHEGVALGPGAGLGAPPDNRQAAVYSVQQSHAEAPNARLANAKAMVRGLREGFSARLVQGQAVAAGPMGTPTGEIGVGDRGVPGGGLAPSGDYGSTARATETPLVRAAAAANLEVHSYGYASFRRPMDAVALARAEKFSGAPALMGRREGRSKAPEFRSHTLDPAVLGTHADHAFGAVGEHAAPHTGGLALGDKSLRASVLADGGDDVMGAYAGDGFGAAVSEASLRQVPAGA